MSMADDMERLCGGILASHDERIGGISKRRQETANMRLQTADFLSGLKRQQGEMARNLREGLSNFRSSLADSVSKTLATFQKEHKGMADDLRNTLRNDKNERTEKVNDMLNEFKAWNSRMSSAWQNMSRRIAGKRRQENF